MSKVIGENQRKQYGRCSLTYIEIYRYLFRPVCVISSLFYSYFDIPYFHHEYRRPNITLEDFTHWKVPALRDYLSCRGLSAAGNKQEMVAFAYSAHVMKIPPKKTASDNQILNNKCYSDMLKFRDLILPDPFQLYENWQDEKHGMKNWPPFFITDLTTFLMRYIL